MIMTHTNEFQPVYVVCLSDEGNEMSVMRSRLYRVVKPDVNDPKNVIRVIDESGEDYPYPRDWFLAVELPDAAMKAMHAA